MDQVWDVVEEAGWHVCRSRRVRCSLRLETVRLWGYAGSDIETAYRTPAQIEAGEAKNPLVRNARRLVELGAATPEQLRAVVARVPGAGAGGRGGGRRPGAPGLVPRARGWRRWLPTTKGRVRASATAAVDPEGAPGLLGGGNSGRAAASPVKRNHGRPTSALAWRTRCLRRPRGSWSSARTWGRRGGRGVVNYVNRRAPEAPIRPGPGVRHPVGRDDRSWGWPRGRGWRSLLPVPEINSTWPTCHNAVDQIRGGGRVRSSSSRQWAVPRTPWWCGWRGWPTQKGFGGHFPTTTTAFGGLRDIPGGLGVIATPSRRG